MIRPQSITFQRAMHNIENCAPKKMTMSCANYNPWCSTSSCSQSCIGLNLPGNALLFRIVCYCIKSSTLYLIQNSAATEIWNVQQNIKFIKQQIEKSVHGLPALSGNFKGCSKSIYVCRPVTVFCFAFQKKIICRRRYAVCFIQIYHVLLHTV